ncbi:MAG: hypothetical protein M3P85_02785 [Actinomycetota bacterium]|jgi:hypothetical protein|nr:hypothetical protein [Actinomycetota bacterium]PLS75516.1 MAG: hypothetical protein CYG61_06870 [Actinomycetota bacterium]
MVVAFVHVQCLLFSVGRRLQRRLAPRGQEGQASAEYALVLLGAAAVALLVVGWASRTNRVGRLLDGVLDQLLSRVR